MSWLVNNKAVRLVLALNVSFWMAGAACLFGCSNSVARGSEAEVVVAGDSCASTHSHDCCAKKKAPKATSHKSATGLDLSALPAGMMKDCPLAVNATAAISKARADSVDSSVVQTASVTQPEGSNPTLERVSHSPPITSHNPTYLRCCVFLI